VGVTPAPFVVFSLPRSRSHWLSRFLRYGPWVCGHDEVRHVRAPEDIRSWLAQPYAGTCETAAAPFWRTLRTMAPDARVVVVRRPVADVVESLMAMDLGFERGVLGAAMWRADAKLRQVAARWPGALEVTFDGLRDEATCARVFGHCTLMPHNHAWWAAMSEINLQCDLAAMLRWFGTHGAQVRKAAAMVANRTRRELQTRPVVTADGMTVSAETFRDFYRDGQHLFKDHLVEVGEHPDTACEKNIPLFEVLDDAGALQVMTARCNGRMFGYLVTLLSPTLEHMTRKSSVNTIFYADPSFPGLGARLQRASIVALKARGIEEVYMRAGTRGSGPRLGPVFRRLGAEPDGEMFRLNLQEA
jgi:hypothetical protein